MQMRKVEPTSNGFLQRSQGFVGVCAFHERHGVIQALCEFCERLFCISSRFKCFALLPTAEVLTGRLKHFRQFMLVRKLVESEDFICKSFYLWRCVLLILRHFTHFCAEFL